MITAGDDGDGAIIDGIYEAVGVVDAARPQACQIGFEWFGFANAGEGFALNVFDEQVDAFQGFFVLPLPVKVVLPGVVGKGNQAFSHRQVPAPLLCPPGIGQSSVAGVRHSPGCAGDAGFP